MSSNGNNRLNNKYGSVRPNKSERECHIEGIDVYAKNLKFVPAHGSKTSTISIEGNNNNLKLKLRKCQKFEINSNCDTEKVLCEYDEDEKERTLFGVDPNNCEVKIHNPSIIPDEDGNTKIDLSKACKSKIIFDKKLSIESECSGNSAPVMKINAKNECNKSSKNCGKKCFKCSDCGKSKDYDIYMKNTDVHLNSLTLNVLDGKKRKENCITCRSKKCECVKKECNEYDENRKDRKYEKDRRLGMFAKEVNGRVGLFLYKIENCEYTLIGELAIREPIPNYIDREPIPNYTDPEPEPENMIDLI